MKISLKDQFTYHPPKTKHRIACHEEINRVALYFATIITENVKDPRFQEKAIDLVQQARMFANQGITFDDLANNKETK